MKWDGRHKHGDQRIWSGGLESVEGQGMVHHKDDDNNHEIFIDSTLLNSLIARSTSKQAFLAYPQQRRFGWVLFSIAFGAV